MPLQGSAVQPAVGGELGRLGRSVPPSLIGPIAALCMRSEHARRTQCVRKVLPIRPAGPPPD